MENRKDFWIAIIIALLVGWIGIQHFYVRQTVWGVLGILFCWTGIPYIVAFIQILIWLFNGKEEFNKKFNK